MLHFDDSSVIKYGDSMSIERLAAAIASRYSSFSSLAPLCGALQTTIDFALPVAGATFGWTSGSTTPATTIQFWLNAASMSATTGPCISTIVSRHLGLSS
jgi:hypothetical protein